ncbi:zinc-dependent alcohol dehydrogenase [Microbacterium invictum]|uniref:Alcohol dehydrogenase catalytic domain-containing protein n=1 Tax=Microbacterium invictum TaxID=515415 RepID=A0ABZ0VEQ1_9MICO|nr:alcohol dehydrogenase catalytic domain-containing protein [Microbacterium invictum]WQB72115.1 alcohol dehydrogenase catalytic domain-containing protein [Microbacterium invictum]
MKAVRWHGRGDLRVDTVPVPSPADDEILLRVGWAGICGTDLEELQHGPLTIPIEPHVSSGRSAPLILGHEVVGQVALAAENGEGPLADAWVVPDVVQGCGKCWWCESHDEGLCPSLNVLGQTDDGALAEFMVAKASRCLPVPTGVDARTAALAEPLAVAVRAVDKLELRDGSTVAVLGGGTIGQLVAQVLAASNARVLLVDPVSSRRDLAANLSGAVPLAPDEFESQVLRLPPPGLDAVVECGGRDGLIDQALRAVRPGGTVVAVGLRTGSEPIDVPGLVLGERRLVGSAAHMWDTDVARALALLDELDIEPLITHEVPLADSADAFSLLSSGDPGVLKVLISAS